ncbi:hypothetical protein R1sor_010904 [Riccia sorocarpa]|uniref:Uncharacterized protein n=1 Tax=Riccia sorocarpa TaxID=122646 RepID=A0ABD3HZE5_9MARC
MQLEDQQSVRAREWISRHKTQHNDRTRSKFLPASPFTIPGNRFEGWSLLEEGGISKNEREKIRLRFGDGLFLEYFLHRLFCMPTIIKSLLRLVGVQLVKVWRTGQLDVSTLGHPKAYAQGGPMVEEIIRLWELSGMWTCSYAMHNQTRDLSTKDKKKLEEGQSEEDVGHRCVEFPPLPEEVASWFKET